jgi:hypothetical protein
MYAFHLLAGHRCASGRRYRDVAPILNKTSCASGPTGAAKGKNGLNFRTGCSPSSTTSPAHDLSGRRFNRAELATWYS